MKSKWIWPLVLGLTLIGCSSSNETSTTNSVNTSSLAQDLDLPEEFFNSSVEPDVNSALAAIPVVNFEDVKAAFKEAGFSLDGENAQGMELEFEARNSAGELKISAQKMESIEQAEAFVQDKITALESNGYEVENTQTTDDTALTTLVFPSNGIHYFVGLDKEATRVYVVEEISESSHQGLEVALHSLGF